MQNQPDVTFAYAHQRHRVFPDFGIFDRAVLLESDSMIAHSTSQQLERDTARQYELSQVFDVIRFPASQILRDPDGVATSINNRLASRPLVPLQRTHGGFRITPTANGALLVAETERC